MLVCPIFRFLSLILLKGRILLRLLPSFRRRVRSHLQHDVASIGTRLDHVALEQILGSE